MSLGSRVSGAEGRSNPTYEYVAWTDAIACEIDRTLAEDGWAWKSAIRHLDPGTGEARV